MAEANTKQLLIMAVLTLGVGALILGAAIFVPNERFDSAISTIVQTIIPTLAALLAYMKSQEAVAKVDKQTAISKDNNAELKDQTKAIETIKEAVTNA